MGEYQGLGAQSPKNRNPSNKNCVLQVVPIVWGGEPEFGHFQPAATHKRAQRALALVGSGLFLKIHARWQHTCAHRGAGVEASADHCGDGDSNVAEHVNCFWWPLVPRMLKPLFKVALMPVFVVAWFVRRPLQCHVFLFVFHRSEYVHVRLVLSESCFCFGVLSVQHPLRRLAHLISISWLGL